MSEVDFDKYENETYTKEELSKDDITFGGTDGGYIYEIKTLQNGEKYLSMCTYKSNNSSGAGGSIVHNLPNALEKGTVMLDISVRADSTNMTRNLFILKSSDSKKVYTMSLDSKGKLYGATQGTYGGSKYFTGQSYKTDDDDFYNLRVVLTRNNTDFSWDFSVYDRLTSYTSPVYKIEIPAATLKDIQSISSIDLWNATTTQCYLDVKESVLFTPTTEDLILNSTIVDEQGKELTEFKDIDKLYLKYDAENITAEDISLCVFVNVFYENRLEKVSMSPAVIKGKAKDTGKMLEIDLDGVTAYNSIEIFIWKADEIVPVCPKQELIYSSNGVEAYTLENKVSKIVSFIPQNRIVASEAIPSNFKVFHGEKEIDIEEVRLESATNTVRICLKDDIPVSDGIEVQSNALMCMNGEKMSIDCALYPYVEEGICLYDIGFHRMTVYDDKGKQVSVVPEKGEYTIEIEFVNNNSLEHEVKGTLILKGNRTIELDKFCEKVQNYSRYVYKKKFNLEKGDIISLIL